MSAEDIRWIQRLSEFVALQAKMESLKEENR